MEVRLGKCGVGEQDTGATRQGQAASIQGQGGEDLLNGLECIANGVLSLIDSLRKARTGRPMDQRATSDSRKRARTPIPDVSALASEARERHTDLSRTSAVASVPHDSLCHIFGYLDRRRPCVLTTVAHVSRAWKTAAYIEELWVMAAHTLVPATAEHDHPQVRKLLRAVGGYQALVFKYGRAIWRWRHSLTFPRGGQRFGLDWLKEPRQVIFEVRDRVRRRVVLSEVGEPGFSQQEAVNLPCLFADDSAALYALKVTPSDMLLPWEGADVNVIDILTQHDRFQGRMLIVNPFTGRISVVFATSPHGKFVVAHDGGDHTFQSPHIDIPHEGNRGTKVQGALWFQVEKDESDDEVYEFCGVGLELKTDNNSCRGMADVVEAMYNAA